VTADRDRDPWWAADHVNDGLGPYDSDVPSGTAEEDARPSRAELAEQLRLDRAEWARAEARRAAGA
jgi:hypothetical protein